MDNQYIKIRNLNKAYTRKEQSDVVVFQGIDLDIDQEEFVCFVGSSGCGKSTLLRIISGLDNNYDGVVEVAGKQVDKPDKNRGFVYQESRLFPWMSIEDNVRFVINGQSRDVSKKKARETLALVGLAHVQKAYPYELSGGMAQRANIARALVNAPELLLLDEPFGALDAFTKMQLQEELLKIKEKQKNTMLMVTHDIEEAVFLADRIVVLGGEPTAINEIIPNDISHPRDRNSIDFVNVKKKVLKYFKKNLFFEGKEK